MKYIAVQTGARRGYAVPAILENAGMLERFYTDLAGNCGLGSLLSAIQKIPGISGKLPPLSSRYVPQDIISKTQTFGLLYLNERLKQTVGSKDSASSFKRHLDSSQRLQRAMIRAGFGQATHVFSMLSEAGSFMTEAYQRGLTVVAEVYILLSTERLLHEERKAFPNWEPEVADYSELRRRWVKVDPLIEYTHLYICPSAAVQDDLIDKWGVPKERTQLVPYGMNPRWLELEPKPKPGRILFVGTADLRKGIHYLALAAEKLHARGHRYEIRVAGDVSAQVTQQSACRHLTFLGRVPRHLIHEEFQQADLFVLPSLAEGSAEVTYEALAAGLPLVVTAAAGSVARDGIEARIIPDRDSASLADAIESIVEDRILRNRFAYAARERARDYTWEKYGVRLVTALESFKR